MAITATVAAVASAGAGIYEGEQANERGKHVQKQGDSLFNEQQGYAKQLDDLMKNPSAVTELPGYKFQFDQGSQAVARRMAASGFNGSGNEAIALTEFGQGYAQSAYGQQAQLLASLSGLTTQSPNSYNQTAQQGQAQSFEQLSKSLASLGYTLGQHNTGGGTSHEPWGGTWNDPSGSGYVYNVPGAGP